MSRICPPLSYAVPTLSQHGAGATEFLIAAVPILFAGLGGVELSHWFFTRQAVSAALLDAGRAAITHHNRADPIIAAFEHSLRPLYTSSAPGTSSRRLADALAMRTRHMNGAPWQIELLSPSAQAYADFSDSQVVVDGASGYAIINNHYLAEQDARYRAKGWANGRGPVSGQTVYEANTAVLRLSWLHKPQLPLLTPILKALGNPQGSYLERAFAQGYLPMTRQVALLMQSHPVRWADDPGGKVLYQPEGSQSVSACVGWLCNANRSADRFPEPAPSVGTDDGLPLYSEEPELPAPDDGGNNSGDGDSHGFVDPDDAYVGHPDLAINPDDPACGVTLCCV